jgi:hypothetical protein
MNTPRPLYELAVVIEREVRTERQAGKTASWFGYAKPYVEALHSLSTTADSYYYDSGDSVVRYLLANLGSWRGDVAREVKAELKAHL